MQNSYLEKAFSLDFRQRQKPYLCYNMENLAMLTCFEVSTNFVNKLQRCAEILNFVLVIGTYCVLAVQIFVELIWYLKSFPRFNRKAWIILPYPVKYGVCIHYNDNDNDHLRRK